MKQTTSIPAAAALLASGILLSRLLGYVREMLLAYKFGASGMTDAFYAAFQIPDLLNYFLSGGALSIAFIPLYNKTLAKDGEGAANEMMGAVLGTLGGIVIAATALLWWKADALIRFQFPHFSGDTRALTVHLTRIVLPAQVFFITGGIVQAVLLARKNFTVAAVSPLVYNAFIIAGGYFLYPFCGIDGFAIGTLVGSIAGPFLLPILYSSKYVFSRHPGASRGPAASCGLPASSAGNFAPASPVACEGAGNAHEECAWIPVFAGMAKFIRFAPFDKVFLIYLALAAPLMFGQTLLTLDEWYCRWFGALLSTGTVAHLSYARRLMQVPIAVIGQAVAAAALPTLSKYWSENRTEELNKTLQQTLNTGLALSVLAGAAFYALAKPLVVLVYRQGVFMDADADSVAGLVAIFAFAMPGWILQQISVRAFYARGDTWRPMALGTLLSLLVIPVYLSFSKLMGADGLAIAGALSMTVNAAATLIFARKMHGAPALLPLLISSFGRSAAIAVPAVLAAHAAIQAGFGEGFSLKVAALLDSCAGGAAFALVAIPGVLLFGDPELRVFIKRVLKIKA